MILFSLPFISNALFRKLLLHNFIVFFFLSFLVWPNDVQFPALGKFCTPFLSIILNIILLLLLLLLLFQITLSYYICMFLDLLFYDFFFHMKVPSICYSRY